MTSLKFFEYGDSISDLVNYELMEGEWLDGDQMSVESITKNNEDVYTTGAAFELKGFTEEGTKSTLQWVVDYTNACSEDPFENISSIAWLQFVSLAFVTLSSIAKSNRFRWKSFRSPRRDTYRPRLDAETTGLLWLRR